MAPSSLRRSAGDVIEAKSSYRCGEILAVSHCSELGKQTLEKTLDTHPNSLRAHLLLADLALQQDEFSRAREEYQAAVALALTIQKSNFSIFIFSKHKRS